MIKPIIYKHNNMTSAQGSKWDGTNWYGIPALLWPLGNNTSTSFLRKVILVCFAGHFVRFRQLVADVFIDQWPK